jgi:hypothetical protein
MDELDDNIKQGLLQLRADNLKKWRKLQDEFAADGDIEKYRKALYEFRVYSATTFLSVTATQ